MASRVLNQVREQNPSFADKPDHEVAREVYEQNYSDLDFSDFANRVELEPLDRFRALNPDRADAADEEIAEELYQQSYSDLDRETFASQVGVSSDFGVSARPSGPRGADRRSIREQTEAPIAEQGSGGAARRDARSQAPLPTIDEPQETRRERRADNARPEPGATGRDFSLARGEGLGQAATLRGGRDTSLAGEPMRVDQNADEAAQTVYQMQGRGERSADDLRRGVNRGRSALNAFELIDSVSSLAAARERTEDRDALSVDARQRLTGEQPDNPAFSAEAIERRLVSAERRDQEVIAREEERSAEIAGNLAELQRAREELGENVTLQRALADGDADTFLDQLLSENFTDVMSGLVLESLPAMAPALGAGVAGGVAAGPAGFAVGTGTVSGLTEGVLSVQEKLQEYGADLSDPDSVNEVWQENGSEILKDSATRAALIGAFDAASGGLAATRVIPRAGTGAGFAERAARNTAEGATQLTGQAVAGASGEASAQVAETGEINNPAAVLAEGVAEFGFAPVEVAGAAFSGARRRIRGAEDSSQLRDRMVREGFTPNDDGTLRRGDVVVDINDNEATARLVRPNIPVEPRPGAQDDGQQEPVQSEIDAIDGEIERLRRGVIAPSRETPAGQGEQAASEAEARVEDLLIQRQSLIDQITGTTPEPTGQAQDPSAELDSLVSDFEPQEPQTPQALSIDEQLENTQRELAERREALRSAGVPDEQAEADPRLQQLSQISQSLSEINRQAESRAAEQSANTTIDSDRAPTDDALGLQVQSIRQEAEARSPLRDEIQRLRERASAPAQAPDLAPAPEQPDQPAVSPQPDAEPTVRANGQPFSTQASVRRSAPFRNAANPEIVPIGEGFGVIDRGETGASLDSFPRLEGAEPDRAASARPVNNPATGEFTTERVATQNIEIDPDTYQFRDDVNRDGVDDRLEGITRFDDLRAGTIILHERNDGRTFVADGHHRIDLARRLGRDSINAIVLRESDGFSTADARRFAAERNVSEGNATPIDAAKVFREYGGDPSTVAEDRDLPRRSQVVRDGAAIAQLSDDAFGAVLNEQITEKDAASIGRNFTDADQQLAAVEQFQRVRPANDRQREILADEIRRAGFSQGEQGGLFGNDPAESLITERVQVKDATQRRLSRRSSLFRTLNENAGAAERAGNQIARDQNSAIQQNAAIAADLVRRADTTPELNQAINEAAQRVKDGEPIARVAGELEERIVNEAQRLGSTPQGPASDPSLGSVDQAGQDARAGESVPPADTGRDGEGREQRLPGEESELLTQPTPEDLQARDQAQADQQAAQREANQRADADAQRDDFTLTGSDTEADQAAARGQDALFEDGNVNYGIGSQEAFGQNPNNAVEESSNEQARQGDLFTLAGADNVTQRAPDSAFNVDGAAEVLSSPTGRFGTVTSTRRTGTYSLPDRPILTAADAATATAQVRKNAQENLVALVTDSNGNVLDLIRHSVGDIASAPANNAVIAGSVLRVPGAANVWLSHNHPGGVSTLSSADIRTFDAIKDLTDGSGITVRGMLAIGDTRYSSRATGEPDINEAEVPPARRTREISLSERTLQRRAKLGRQIMGPPSAIETAKTLGGQESGIVLLNQRNAPVAWVPVSIDEMAAMRGTGVLGRILQSIERSNSTSAIISIGKGKLENPNNQKAIANMQRFFADASVRALDTVSVEPEMALSENPLMADDVESYQPKAFFSRAESDVTGLSASEVRRQAAGLMQDWRIAPPVDVVQSENDLPQSIRREILASQNTAPVRGAFHQGRAYVVADNLRSIEDMEETILHEVIGHFGLRNVLGEGMNKTLDDVYTAIGERDIQSIASRRGFDLNDESQRREAVEEYLAELAQADPQAKIIDRIVRLVAEWARSMGFNLSLTNAEVRELIVRAKRFVQDGEIIRGMPINGQPGSGVAMPPSVNKLSARFSFVGTESETANLGSLEEAKSLRDTNRSPEVIRQQTGWFVGVDGKWRYEITDDGAALIESDRPDVSEILEEMGDQIEVYQTVPGWYGATTQDGQFVMEGLGRTEQEARESLARRISMSRGGPAGIRTDQANEFYRLDKILDHEKLYAAYTDLGGLLVHVKSLDGARGRYWSGDDVIEMDATSDRDAFLSTLLHEVQHAIQHREGFATGGNTNTEFWHSVKSSIQDLDTDARNRVLGWQFDNQALIDQAEEASFNATMGLAYQSAQRLRDYASRDRPSGVFRLIRREAQWIYEPTFDRLDEGRRIQGEFFNIPRRGPRRNEAIARLAYDAAELIESQIPDGLLSEFRSDGRKLDSMVRALRRNADRARDNMRELSQLQREAARARSLRESRNLFSPFDTYRALAGEIEARNTQARQAMTAEERARRSPEVTQDMRSEEAIVIVGGAELMVPQTSFDTQQERSAVRFSRRGVNEANSSKESTESANQNGMPVKHRNDAAKETTAYVARDNDGNWVTVKTSDPALREQRKLRAAMKRWFTKEGQLTDRAYELHTQMIGQRNADEIDISGFTADFMQAVSQTYGRSYVRLDDSDKAVLNEYLAGRPVDIPEQVRESLDVMRGMLDNMSTRTQMMLLDEVKYTLQDMSGEQSARVAGLIRRAKNGDDEAISEIREVAPHGNLIARKMRTFLAIEANKGGYLHRSYRAFDDPSWKDSVPDDVMRRAKAYLRDQVQRDPTLQSLDASGIEDRVDGIVNAILNSNSSDMVDFLSQSQLGEKDLSVLKQRENIPEPIRDLMGEYKDPRVNFSRTMSHMTTLLASHHFLRSVREEGLGAYLSAQPSGRMSQEITSFNEEKMLPLAGLYTTPEFRQALIDFADGNNLEGFMKHVIRLTSSVKYGKTVLSPTTMFRNFYSASMFSVMNGHFGYSNTLKAAQTTWADIRGNTRARRDYMRRLAELGVIHDSARAGEISAALDDVMDLDTTRGSAPARVAKSTLNIATRMYQAGDDFWKIVGYETEVKDLTDTGMDRQEAEALAAKRVRDGYPTYSMVPEAIQRLRRFPLVGTFVSFPWEVMRTSFNQIRMVQEDARAGRNAKAMRRLTGMAVAYSSAYAVKTATMAMFGIDDDEDEAIRKLAAPWQMNSQFAYLGNDEDGRMRYLDLSHLDPYNHLKRPISALMNGNYDNLGQAAIEGTKEFLAPYLGTDITAGVFGEIWANKKQSSGTEVYDENADILTQGYEAGEHLLSTLRPGVLLNVERTWKAFNNQMTSYGREYTLEDEGMAWVGFRLTTSDPKVSMQFKAFDFDEQRSSAGRPTYNVLRDPNPVSDAEMQSGVESTYSRWIDAFEEMHSVVRAARVSGMGDEEIAESLEKGGVPKRDIGFIVQEKVPPWSPSDQSMQNAINSVLQYNESDEMRDNLRDRFRAMRRSVIEQRRTLMQSQAE